MVNKQRELLALRRDVLAARSAMLRLRAARDLQAVRESFSFGRVATRITGSTPARSLLFGALLAVAGGRGLSRILRVAAAVLAGAKLARYAARLASQPRPTSAASSQSSEAAS